MIVEACFVANYILGVILIFKTMNAFECSCSKKVIGAISLSTCICIFEGYFWAILGKFCLLNICLGYLVFNIILIIINRKNLFKKNGLNFGRKDVFLILISLIYVFFNLSFSNEMGSNGQRDNANYYYNALHIAQQGELLFAPEEKMIEDDYERILMLSSVENNGVAFVDETDETNNEYNVDLEVWNLPMFSTCLATGFLLGGVQGIYFVITFLVCLAVLNLLCMLEGHIKKEILFGAMLLILLNPAVIYASRVTLSECLCMFLLSISGLICDMSVKNNNIPYQVIGYAIMAVSIQARIDMYICIAGVLLINIYRSLFRDYRKRDIVANFVLIGMTALGTVIDAYISPNYLRGHFFDLGAPLRRIILLCTCLAGLWMICLLIRKCLGRRQEENKFIDLMSKFINEHIKKINLLVLIISLLIIKRSYCRITTNFVDGFCYNMQRVSWYTSWIVIIMSCLGVVWNLKKIFYDRILFGICTIGTLSSLIYIYRPSIVDDQYWWSRRYVTVIIPFLVVMAVVGMGMLKNKKIKYLLFSIVLCFEIYVSRSILFSGNAKGLIANTNELADKIETSQIYFCEDSNTSAILMAGYGKKCFSLDKKKKLNINNYLAENEEMYYIGDLKSLRGSIDLDKYCVKKQFENIFYSYELDKDYNCVPQNYSYTVYKRNIYKIYAR